MDSKSVLKLFIHGSQWLSIGLKLFANNLITLNYVVAGLDEDSNGDNSRFVQNYLYAICFDITESTEMLSRIINASLPYKKKRALQCVSVCVNVDAGRNEADKTPHSFRIHWSRSSYHIDWNDIGMWFENARLAFNMKIKIKLWNALYIKMATTKTAAVAIASTKHIKWRMHIRSVEPKSKQASVIIAYEKRISSIWLHLVR